MRCIPGQVRAGQTAVSALGSHSPACVRGGRPERSQHASPSSEGRAALVGAHEGAASHSLRKGADNRYRGLPRPQFYKGFIFHPGRVLSIWYVPDTGAVRELDQGAPSPWYLWRTPTRHTREHTRHSLRAALSWRPREGHWLKDRSQAPPQPLG